MFGRWVWDAWLIANALEKGSGAISFWNEGTGFYHDVIEMPDRTARSLEVFSAQSIVPLFAAITVPLTATDAVRTMKRSLVAIGRVYGHTANDVSIAMEGGDGSHVMLAIIDPDRLATMLRRILDPEQFMSPYGIRSLSKLHRKHPYRYYVHGTTYEVSYQPAESRTRMFGGNSNWRGPVWLPTNFLVVQSLTAYDSFLGQTFRVPDPDDRTRTVTLGTLADGLARRLTALLVRDENGRRAVLGDNDYFQTDPHWRDLVPFYEYFDGDTGRGLGASHQTGWTATVALLLQFRASLNFAEAGRQETRVLEAIAPTGIVE